MSIKENLSKIRSSIPENVTLVAVSKTKPNESILEAYESNQLIFGENKIQDLVAKYESLPKDIQWHMIGHVQTNKIKYIAPFVSLIHGVDREKVLSEINKQGLKNDRIIHCLLQIHIAQEESKFGFSEDEVLEFFENKHNDLYPNVKVVGLMGMASNVEDENQIRSEFRGLKELKDKIYKLYHPKDFDILSMGMSGDYKMAIEEGSTMIRVGSSIFGARNY